MDALCGTWKVALKQYPNACLLPRKMLTLELGKCFYYNR